MVCLSYVEVERRERAPVVGCGGQKVGRVAKPGKAERPFISVTGFSEPLLLPFVRSPPRVQLTTSTRPPSPTSWRVDTMNRMEDLVLAATHISSLYSPAQVAAINVPGAARAAPLASRSTSSGTPVDHASFSSIFHSETTGAILLRIIDAGSTLELSSLNTEVPPVRFVFPDRILPSPGIFISPYQNIHILAVTSAGSLYRIVLPAADGLRWLPGQMGSKWCREYIVKHGSGRLEGVVKAQSIHCVVLGEPNGVMVRLETEGVDDYENTGTHASLAYPAALSESMVYRQMDGNHVTAIVILLHSHILCACPQP